MLPHELADEACSLRPNEDRLTRDRRDPSRRLEPGEPTLPPLGDPQPTSASRTAQAQRILAGRGAARARRRRSGSPTASRPSCAVAASRAARSGSRRPEVNFAFDGRGGVERAWLEAEPSAHALIEELMILANEAVAAFTRGREGEVALPRPRAARAAGGRAPALEAGRPRGADPAGAEAREHEPGGRGAASPRRRASA